MRRRRRGAHTCWAPDPSDRVQGPLGRGIRALEELNCRWPRLARRYGRRFYEAMVREEARLAGIEPGAHLLHVGCGAYPFTALTLAQLGYTVVGVDRDPGAAAMARRVVKAMGRQERIRIEHAHGESVNTSAFDAVWVSLHVWPRAAVLANCLQGLRIGGRMVVRDAAGPLRLLYRQMSPAGNGVRARVHCAQAAGRRNLMTVLIEKLAPTAQSEIALSSLCPGRCGRITATHGCDPLMEALGIRPGRCIRVKCVQAMGGSLVAELAGRRVAIDQALAHRISVAPELEHPSA